MDWQRSQNDKDRAKWLKALFLLALGVGGCLSPRDAEAQLRTKVGSLTAPTAPAPATQSVTGIGFQPKAVIFFWTNQTAAGFADHAAIGYGFSAGASGNRAVGFSSRHSIPNGVYTQTNPARMQRADACVFFTDPDGTLDGQAAITSMDPTGGFTLDWAPQSSAARIVHYMALGGPDITDAAVGTFTPSPGTSPPGHAVTVGFQPDFLMFLSIDSNTAGSSVADGKVSLGYAGRSLAYGITQGGVTVVSPVTDTTVTDIFTSGAQRTDAAIVEKDFTTGASSSTFVGAVQSFDPTGFTLDKMAHTAGTETPVYYLALRGGSYRVDVLRTTSSSPSHSRPDTEAMPLSKSYTGAGFAPRGLFFTSWNLRSSNAHEDARISFSAADTTPGGFNQRATFFNDRVDLPSGRRDASWVRQATSGTDVSPGKAVLLAQAGDCYPKHDPPPAPPVQCYDPARVITDADVTRYDPDGFTLNWTTNDLTNMNGFAGSDEANAQVLYVAFGSTSTTEVTLASFTARGEDSAVLLEWETASELDNQGFHLYRSASETGPWTRITSSLIPGLSSSPVGARYSYADTGLTNGVTYYYQLEDVETTGRTERHGPVSAVPVAGATTGDSGGDPGTDPGTEPGGGGSTPAESTRVPYGDPSSVSLQVLRRDSTGVDLELVTGGFSASPAPDGAMNLDIPGFELQGTPGTPAIPVERTFLEAVAGRQVRITSVVPSDVLSFPWSRPALAGAPELLVGRDGTVKASFRRVRPAWVSRRPYPAEAARIVTTAFQGETKKALLELAPLRWNSSTGQLLLTRRLRVRVAFDGVEPAEIPLGGSRGRSLPRQGARGSRAAQGLVAHLLARDQGLYAVAFEDVFRYHRRALPTPRLRLARLGQNVAFHVEPDPSRFSPGSVLYFVSEGGSLSAYANEAVYELALAESGTAMPIVASPPAGPVLAEAVEHRSWETNQYYISGLLEAPDLWLWASFPSGTPPKRFSFQLSGLTTSSAPATLAVWLQGASDFESSPDHHVRLYVNGSFVAEASWDGKTARRLKAALYPGLLHDGENSLDIENVGDTPAAVSLVYLDRFSLEHPRVLAAEAGRFEAVFGSPGSATLAGLGADSLVLDTTGDAPRWVVGAAAGPAGLTLGTEAGHRYLAVSPEAVLRPGIRWPSMARGDLRGADNQADYLLLAPRQLLPAAAPLLQLREEQGLRARAVALEEIYDAFGHGEKSPAAIRDFIAHAYHRWTPPSPRYVLLLGDATFDPKDYAKTGVKDHLPVFMFKSTWLWTASDPAYASVNGEDSLPDLAIGRLPASGLEQAESLVRKLVAFERSGFDPSAPAVLVADNPDRAGDFEADADDIASGPLASYATEKIYLGRLGTEPTRSAIVSAFDRGASLMSYVGHGAPAIWASEILLHSDDVAKLSPQARQPLLFTMNCLNGYFFAPAFDSLAEALVKAEDKGAIAAVSPSGLSLDAAAHVYHKAVVAQVASGHHARLGDAILAAQSDYATSGVFPELLRVYNLLGDPAMRIR